VSKPSVLCVDDEPAILSGLERLLRPRFEVSVAPNGQEGLDLVLHGGPFAVVVSDMRMPGMDGAEFLSRVRTAAPGSVRMLLTGHADLGTALLAVNEAQAHRLLPKPCPPEVLVAALDAAATPHRPLGALSGPGLPGRTAAAAPPAVSREMRSMRTEVRPGAAGQISVIVEGAFDTPDVATLVALAESLWRHAPRSRLTLDFHGAREVSDLAIARLADEMRRAPDGVALAGLSQRHQGCGEGVRAPGAGVP